MKSVFVVPLANRIVLPYPHCRLPSLHTHAAYAFFRSASSPLHLQHLASRYMLLSTSPVDWEKTASRACHFVCSALVQMRKNGTPKPLHEKHFSLTRWHAEIHHMLMKMNLHLVDLQMSNITLQKPSSISQSGIKVAPMKGSLTGESKMVRNQMESERTDCEYVLLPFKCHLNNRRGEAARPPFSCWKAQRWSTYCFFFFFFTAEVLQCCVGLWPLCANKSRKCTP